MIKIYVNIPKDIFEIKEKLFFGLTKRQIISIIIALIFIINTYVYLKKFLGLDSLYVGAMLAMPTILFGFFEDNGVFLEQKIKNYIYFLKNNQPKVYKSENFYEKMQKNLIIDKEIKKYRKLNERR